MNSEKKKGNLFIPTHMRTMSNLSNKSSKLQENLSMTTATLSRPMAQSESLEEIAMSRLGKLLTPSQKNKYNTDTTLPEIDKSESLNKLAMSSESFQKLNWSPIPRMLKLPSKTKLTNLLKMEGLST